MNIPHSLSLVIQRSHSLGEILDSSVQLVAQQMGTDVCSIYLLDPTDQQIRLSATHGLDKSSLGKVTLSLGEGLTGKVVRELTEPEIAGLTTSAEDYAENAERFRNGLKPQEQVDLV